MRKDLPSHKNQTGTACGRRSRPVVTSQITNSFFRRLRACLPGATTTTSIATTPASFQAASWRAVTKRHRGATTYCPGANPPFDRPLRRGDQDQAEDGTDDYNRSQIA